MWMSNRNERVERLEERNRLVESQSSARNWDKNLEDADYFIVDIETSGFDAARDLVLSLASARMYGETVPQEVSQYDLIRHESLDAVPPAIWNLTGLNPEALQDGHEWHDVLMRALSLSANRVWIAHHARHELAFMQRHARQLWKMKLHPLVIDTAMVAQGLFRLERVPTLEALCEMLDVPVGHRHQADADVLMTSEVWRREMEHCRALGLTTIGAVIDWTMSHAG